MILVSVVVVVVRSEIRYSLHTGRRFELSFGKFNSALQGALCKN